MPMPRLVPIALAGAVAVVMLVGCATHDAARAPDPVRAVEVAGGVFLLPGMRGEVGAANLGRLGNAGFIVGEAGVLAIDAGTSYRHGRELLAAIARVTDKPVREVVLTHARQEFLFGAAAFREQGARVVMHREAARLMAARCENCLKTLRRVLGDEEMRGTVVPSPDAVFDGSFELEGFGRPIRVLYFGHSSGPGDVAVLDERTRTIFAGGLVDWLRIPDVQDGDLRGWSAALDALAALRPAVVVPGHGPAAGPASIGITARYLAELEGRVLDLLRRGAALSEVPDAAALADFAGWDQADTIHRRNASVVFVRKEREQMFRPE
jgi:glyoxylase-like metal-dependent hydrolase (beta-lactamase superfamily II)